MTQEELLSIIDSANENNSIILRQEKRIEELEKKLALKSNSVSNISSNDDTNSNNTYDDELIEMSFSEAFKELIKHENIKPSEQREYNKDIFEKMKIVLDKQNYLMI